MKRRRGLGRRGRVRKQREREWVGHSRYLTLKRSLDLEPGDRLRDQKKLDTAYYVIRYYVVRNIWPIPHCSFLPALHWATNTVTP
jgi:hypothetical protein